jgi:hypothetical protein
LQECQPQEFWKTRAQRFFTYFCSNVSFAHYFRTSLLNSPDPAVSRERIAAYFTEMPEDRLYMPDRTLIPESPESE